MVRLPSTRIASNSHYPKWLAPVIAIFGTMFVGVCILWLFGALASSQPVNNPQTPAFEVPPTGQLSQGQSESVERDVSELEDVATWHDASYDKRMKCCRLLSQKLSREGLRFKPEFYSEALGIWYDHGNRSWDIWSVAKLSAIVAESGE